MHHVILIRNLLLYLYIGLFFLFPRLQPIAFSLAFFLTLFTGEFKGNIKSVFANRYFILFTLFFISYALSISYSENKTLAWSGFELKLSFLVFPLFFPLILNGGKIKTRRLLEFAYISALLSFFVCLFRAAYRFIETPELDYFFSSEFSFIVHPSYLAVMLNVLLTIALYRLVKSKTVSKKIWISIFLLAIYILLSASKIGLILLFLNALGTIVVYAIKNNQFIKTFLLLIGVVVASVLAVKFIPTINNKFEKALEETFDKNYSDPTIKLSSTGQRIVSWKASKEIIKENLLLGVGMGDLKDELIKKHQENGFKLMEEKRLDSHQQFMQTWATVGIFGFILLFLIFSLIMYDSLKNKSYILFMFGLSFLLFGVTESMLETQAGVLSFLTFFYILSNKSIIRILKSSL